MKRIVKGVTLWPSQHFYIVGDSQQGFRVIDGRSGETVEHRGRLEWPLLSEAREAMIRQKKGA